MNNTQTTHTLIIGAGFAGLYLSHLLRSQHHEFLLVAPDTKTVSDKSYYNFRSRGVKQMSLKASMLTTGRGGCNRQLVNILVNNIDDELTHLSHLTTMHASYLGARVAHPFALLKKLREQSAPHRLVAEVREIRKRKGTIIVETTTGTIHCTKVVFCTGGNRARFSSKFHDEHVENDAHGIARRAGCKTQYLDKVMLHPFYSNGVCIPSDSLFGFDVVDEHNERLALTYQLLASHNAHHRFDDICKEYARTEQRFAVKGNTRIPLEIEPHYVLGGMVIHKHGETSIKDIYALGECSYGMHGHDRIGGGSLSEIIVMARIIAKRLVGK